MTQDPDAEKLLDHQYDGIQEYDNPLPRWWVYIFWATILWSAAYFVLPGDLGHGGKKDAMYAKEMAAWEARIAAQARTLGKKTMELEVAKKASSIFRQLSDEW